MLLNERKQMLRDSHKQVNKKTLPTQSPKSNGKKKFVGHSWMPRAIRDEPNRAFDLFDANCDGVISVAELTFTARATSAVTRLRGDIYNEMKLFALLDLDGDAVISRQEFCEAVRDKTRINDEALSGLCALCELRKAEIKKQARLSIEKNKENLVLDLVATAPWISVQKENIANATTETCRSSVRSAECVISGINEDGERIELAKSKPRSPALWSPVIKGEDIYRLGECPSIRIELSDEKNIVGTTETFEVGPRETEDPFVGPLTLLSSPLTTDDSATPTPIASISGTLRWLDPNGDCDNVSIDSPKSMNVSSDISRPRRTPRKSSSKHVVFDSPTKDNNHPISCVAEYFNLEYILGGQWSCSSSALCAASNDDVSGCILFNNNDSCIDTSTIRS
uniref:EF-hand domain-containing protein n=1 Tax=Aureoumbra lagunensis TaxID=44058 RepID=A0A7S3JXG4_9STRA|mmetsp:Transcript_14065/g.17515  ORF Transcript_14065/g.17515 Transcript_14065/m.17515 type:complete len:395 (-) Transcript_14065:705-1889(-)